MPVLLFVVSVTLVLEAGQCWCTSLFITGDTPLKCVSCVSLQLEVYMLILSRSLASINMKICLTMHLMNCINATGNYSQGL